MDVGTSNYYLYLKGDNSGLEELVNLYNCSLVYFLNGYVKNITVAEDLAAQTFIKIMVNKNPFINEKYSFKTWLFKIGRNNAIDYLRKQSKSKCIAIDDVENELYDKCCLEEIILKSERKRQVHNALNMIKPEYKDIIFLLYFEEINYDEAGFILKKSNKQIKNLIFRAKQALKLILEKEGFIYEN